MEYGDVLVDLCSNKTSELLESVQFVAAFLVTGTKYTSSHDNLHIELGWKTRLPRRPYPLSCFTFYCYGSWLFLSLAFLIYSLV